MYMYLLHQRWRSINLYFVISFIVNCFSAVKKSRMNIVCENINESNCCLDLIRLIEILLEISCKNVRKIYSTDTQDILTFKLRKKQISVFDVFSLVLLNNRNTNKLIMVDLHLLYSLFKKQYVSILQYKIRSFFIYQTLSRRKRGQNCYNDHKLFDWFDLLCLTPLSAIFQLYHGDQF
jgi:hypothetical protein